VNVNIPELASEKFLLNNSFMAVKSRRKCSGKFDASAISNGTKQSNSSQTFRIKQFWKREKCALRGSLLCPLGTLTVTKGAHN